MLATSSSYSHSRHAAIVSAEEEDGGRNEDDDDDTDVVWAVHEVAAAAAADHAVCGGGAGGGWAGGGVKETFLSHPGGSLPVMLPHVPAVEVRPGGVTCVGGRGGLFGFFVLARQELLFW